MKKPIFNLSFEKFFMCFLAKFFFFKSFTYALGFRADRIRFAYNKANLICLELIRLTLNIKAISTSLSMRITSKAIWLLSVAAVVAVASVNLISTIKSYDSICFFPIGYVKYLSGGLLVFHSSKQTNALSARSFVCSKKNFSPFQWASWYISVPWSIVYAIISIFFNQTTLCWCHTEIIEHAVVCCRWESFFWLYKFDHILKWGPYYNGDHIIMETIL